MSTQITVVGTIATDPKHIVTQSGASLCTFRLASDERRFDRTQQKWVDGETNWFGISIFRALGEHAQESFRKGERVVLNGRLRIRTWETNEKSGASADIEVDAIGHDLRWGVSRFERRSVAADSSEKGMGSTAGDVFIATEPSDAFIPVDVEEVDAFTPTPKKAARAA